MASPSTVITEGYGPSASPSLVVTAGYGIGEAVVSSYRTGPTTRHGSVAEGHAVPARPRSGHRVPARPTLDDRTTPANDPHIIG